MKRVFLIMTGVNILMFSVSPVFGKMKAEDHFNRSFDYYNEVRYYESIDSFEEEALETLKPPRTIMTYEN